MRVSRLFVALLVCSFLVAFPAAALGQDDPPAFLHAFQRAVAADRRREVAAMVRYPIVATTPSGDILLRTPAALLASYDRVFTPGLKKVIAGARDADLGLSAKGCMINSGDLWFNMDGEVGPYKIVAISGAADERAAAEAAAKAAPPVLPLRVHPKVFNLINSWISDSEAPVATEISLDAADANGNQFSEEVAQKGRWLTSANEDDGWMSYEVLEKAGNRYTILYSENSGGTLTTNTAIDCVVERRRIVVDGKPKSVRVLRVLGHTLL